MNVRQAKDFLLPYIDSLIPKKTRTLFDIWQQVAGDSLRSHSEVLRFDGEVLIVHVESPAYLSYANMRKSTYERLLQKAIAETEDMVPITKLQFVIAPRA